MADQSSATWYGNAIITRSARDGAPNNHYVDQQTSIGMNGRVTAFRIFATQKNPVELVIYRKVGNVFSIVGRSSAMTPSTLGANEFVLDAPIDVMAGDLVGWHDLTTGAIAFDYSGDLGYYNLAQRVAWNDRNGPTTFTQSSNRVYSIQVRVELAAALNVAAALDLDGANDYIKLPDGVYFNGDFTIEAWVYVKKITSFGSVVDFASAFGGADNLVCMYLSFQKSGKPGFAVRGAGGLNEHTTTDCNVALPLNTWTHIAATLSGTTGSFYINGALVSSTVRNASNQVITAMARPANVERKYCAIGRPSLWPNDASASARFDELRIWNVARTAEEISANMNRELVGDEGGKLVAYYKFNEGIPEGDNTGTPVAPEIKDSAGNHHGTMDGFAKTGASSNWVAAAPGVK